MAENPHAQAAERELLKIPLWFADESKDSFTAEYWVRRMERLKTTCGWSEQAAAMHACNALRGKAIWFMNYIDSLHPDASDNWTRFSKLFLENFGIVGKDTSRITNLNITQHVGEKVQVFAYRVTMTVEEFYSSLPEAKDDAELTELDTIPTGINPPGPPADPAPVLAALRAYAERVAQHFHKRANKMAFQGICKSLFINGLLPSLRSNAKLLKTDTFQEAIKAALTAERAVQGPLDRTTSTDKNVSFIKKRSSKPYRPGGSSAPAAKRISECWYCHHKGHVQLHCRKRLSRGASLVSKPRSVHEIQSEDLAYQEVDDDNDGLEDITDDEDTMDEDEGDSQVNSVHLN